MYSMDTFDIVAHELGIPAKYIKIFSKDRVVIVVHKTWLKTLLKIQQIPEFVYHESLNEDEVGAWLEQDETFGSAWQKLYVKVIRKQCKKVIPLPRARIVTAKTEPELSFSQLLHYVSQTNHKNLWKDAFKKYLCDTVPAEGKGNPKINLVKYDAVMRDIILRTYGCPIICMSDSAVVDVDAKVKSYTVHSNLLPAVCALEMNAYFLLIQQPYIPHTLQDCVTFSPAMLGTTHAKPLFIIYQLLQTLRTMHDRGLVLGDITLTDILVKENLWIQVLPKLEDNIHDKPKTEKKKKKPSENSIASSKTKNPSRHEEDEEEEIGDFDEEEGNFHSCMCKSPFKVHHVGSDCRSSSVSSLDHLQELLSSYYHHSSLASYVDAYSKAEVSQSSHSQKNTKTLDDIRNSYMRTLGVIPGANKSRFKFRESVVSMQESEVNVNEQVDLELLCRMWVYGQLSNFEYLTALNLMAGRRYGDPSSHHVMPWVTDFASRSGTNWRDLSRSKFRLNKGDRQLDLTYDTPAGTSQVPHHVSDVLSEITYYVYLSRRTSRSLLCKYVRTNWVPAEYPSSIQRLQEWTPDECIPEFFTDPTVFESIHDDLPDLEIPSWASSTQDFIHKHREALESVHVSERLHHWIDLTFGYKLSGSAAIKSKNVCLQLVDSHTTLTNRGVVQLFTQPHPQRHLPSPFWGKAPPKLHFPARDKKRPSERVSEDEGHSSGFEEEESATVQGQSRSSPLALSRLLSRSRGSLLTPFPSQSADDSSSRDRVADQQKLGSNTGLGSATPTIILPKEYNPASALQAVEQLHTFMGKTFHCNTTVLLPQFHNENATINMSYKQVVACRRIREMQVLGCLVIELFLASKLRALGNGNWSSFEQRLSSCISVLFRCGESLACCVRQAVCLLLQVELNPSPEESIVIESREEVLKMPKVNIKTLQPFRYPTVTSQGLPPPSAHQLLQPILSSTVFSFPHYFIRTYSLLQSLYDYSSLSEELNMICFVSDSENTINSEIDKKKATFHTKISECKVKTAARELATLLPDMLSTFCESLDLIIPYIRELLEDPSTSVLAAWHLFDPVSKVLGPQKTAATLLEPVLKLYDYALNGDNGSSVPDVGNKHVKLYHRSFLLELIVRLGLRVFLENFAAPLVEAVGGYRDFTQSERLVHHRSDFRNKASHLKNCDLDEGQTEAEGVLSPLDEDSSADSEQNKPSDDSQEIKEKKEEEASDTEIEPEVFVFENEEHDKASPQGEEEAPIYNLMDHLGLNLPQASGEVEDNSSLEIPVDEEYGNQLEEESEDVTAAQVGGELTHDGESMSAGNIVVENSSCQKGKEDTEMPKKYDGDGNFTYGQGSLQKDDKARKFTSQCKVSDMAVDSVVWLAHRLGPVLTARHLSRNLLRMLTLCYLGPENLSPSLLHSAETRDVSATRRIGITKGAVVGDENAAKVLECLASIAALYGEQFILLQYLPHMGELIALCKRKLTMNLEGGLVGCLALLKHIVPYLSDATLMDQLQDVILKTILHPAIRLVSTTRFVFPSGSIARAAVTTKFVDAVYVVALRIGCEMTKRHIAVPSLQRFFLTFDKAFGRPVPQQAEDISATPGKTSDGRKESPLRSLEEGSYLDNRREGSMVDWATKGIPMQISHVRVRESDSADSFSPPPMTGSEGDHPQDQTRNKAVAELKQVFTPELAHVTYLSFFRFLGESVMETSLKNHEFLQDLCYEYEQEMESTHRGGSSVDAVYLSSYLSPGSQGDPESITGSGSFGSNVAVIGNRIDLQRADISSLQMFPSNSSTLQTPCGDFMALISRKMENTNRHLHGNWLAYWEHEIGRAEKDVHFNFKQIKLQTFTGHTNSVRAVLALDNENSFISGSRDKTVKLWSLRSQGDGSAVSQCQWTYTGHRKTVLAISFLESLRLVASCDSVVHLWDPFMGCLLAQLDSARNPPITVLRSMPPPSTSLMAATTDATLRLLDARTCSFVSELKVSPSPAGLIRCITVGPSGNWVAVGQSSGSLTILDIRTGMVAASWKGHEGEILQLVAANDNTLVSSSLDQSVSVWSATDGKLNFHMKGPTEPVHCMSGYEHELISGTTANRIGVHTAVDTQATFSSTRLRSETFKGVLTAMAVLPLNRLLLLGADTGNISLLC